MEFLGVVGFDGLRSTIHSYHFVCHKDWTLQEPEDYVLSMFHLFMTTWQPYYSKDMSLVTFGAVMSMGRKLGRMEEPEYWQRKGAEHAFDYSKGEGVVFRLGVRQRGGVPYSKLLHFSW
jgi:hypothetical protein